MKSLTETTSLINWNTLEVKKAINEIGIEVANDPYVKSFKETVFNDFIDAQHNLRDTNKALEIITETIFQMGCYVGMMRVVSEPAEENKLLKQEIRELRSIINRIRRVVAK